MACNLYIKIVRVIRNVGDRAYAMSHASAEACTHSGWLQGVTRVSACSIWMMTRAHSAISLAGEAPSNFKCRITKQNELGSYIRWQVAVFRHFRWSRVTFKDVHLFQAFSYARWLCSIWPPLSLILRTTPWGVHCGLRVCDISNTTSKLHEIFSTCYLWPWLGSCLTTMHYVMYFRFCGWRHVFT